VISWRVAASEGFKDFIRDQLAGFGAITIRTMFSGAGIYADGVMFALVANDVLYLKADETSARAFAAEGMSPFTCSRTGKEPDELAAWAREAHRIARAGNNKETKPSRRSRRR